MTFARTLLLLAFTWGLITLPARAEFPAPSDLGPTNTFGYGVQRTMRALEEKDPAKRRKIKVLFYGQSITEQRWWLSVKEDLESRYPNAQLEVTNKAIGGFLSYVLEKTAESDLYPHYPDILIFHVYGPIDAYERIIARTRARTTAEIIIQSDHITQDASRAEPILPELITPGASEAYRNYVLLPQIADRYAAELADLRTPWKNYLEEQNLSATNLLSDHVHLNPHGMYLMAELLKPHLRTDWSFEAPSTNAIITYPVGVSPAWNATTLELAFTGNRVDLIFEHRPTPCPLKVFIDDKAPSHFPELYAASRVSTLPNTTWPAMLEVEARTPRVLEDWTLEIIEFRESDSSVRYTVNGSVTGYDGEGSSLTNFVSNSGRVAIPFSSWWQTRYLWSRGWEVDVGEKFTWSVYPRFMDEVLPTVNPRSVTENVVTVASGLANGPHKLTLVGGQCSGLSAIRIYNPLAMKHPPVAPVRLTAIEENLNEVTVQVDGQARYVLESATELASPDWTPISAPQVQRSFSWKKKGGARTFIRARVID